MDRKGFTIIELTITIIIIGILSVSVMIAIINSIQAVSLSNAANKVAADLTFAQNLATSTGQWCGVSFEVSPIDRYAVFVTTGSSDNVVDDPVKRGSRMIVYTIDDYGVSISSVNISGGNKVEFSPIGFPYNDKNGSPLATEGIITLSKGSTSRTVRITPNTGRIYIQ